MIEYFVYNGQKYGIRTKIKYLTKYGTEKTGTVLHFEEDYLGAKIFIGNSIEDLKKQNCDEINLKEFEKFAIKEILGIDTSINSKDLETRDSLSDVLNQQKEHHLQELEEAIQERDEARRKLEEEREKIKIERRKDVLGIILMWGCGILALVTGFAAIMANSIVLAILCFFGFPVIGIVCEKYLLSTQTKKQIQQDKEEKEQKRLYGGYKCPSCGQKSGHPISAVSKGVSIGVWGLASNKIGKAYRCENCGYMW